MLFQMNELRKPDLAKKLPIGTQNHARSKERTQPSFEPLTRRDDTVTNRIAVIGSESRSGIGMRRELEDATSRSSPPVHLHHLPLASRRYLQLQSASFFGRQCDIPLREVKSKMGMENDRNTPTFSILILPETEMIFFYYYFTQNRKKKIHFLVFHTRFFILIIWKKKKQT